MVIYVALLNTPPWSLLLHVYENLESSLDTQHH